MREAAPEFGVTSVDACQIRQFLSPRLASDEFPRREHLELVVLVHGGEGSLRRLCELYKKLWIYRSASGQRSRSPDIPLVPSQITHHRSQGFGLPRMKRREKLP